MRVTNYLSRWGSHPGELGQPHPWTWLPTTRPPAARQRLAEVIIDAFHFPPFSVPADRQPGFSPHRHCRQWSETARTGDASFGDEMSLLQVTGHGARLGISDPASSDRHHQRRPTAFAVSHRVARRPHPRAPGLIPVRPEVAGELRMRASRDHQADAVPGEEPVGRGPEAQGNRTRPPVRIQPREAFGDVVGAAVRAHVGEPHEEVGVGVVAGVGQRDDRLAHDFDVCLERLVHHGEAVGPGRQAGVVDLALRAEEGPADRRRRVGRVEQEGRCGRVLRRWIVEEVAVRSEVPRLVAGGRRPGRKVPPLVGAGHEDSDRLGAMARARGGRRAPRTTPTSRCC